MGADTQNEAQQLPRVYRAPVWVDPEDPTAAVLRRGGAVRLWFVRDWPANWEAAS